MSAGPRTADQGSGHWGHSTPSTERCVRREALAVQDTCGRQPTGSRGTGRCQVTSVSHGNGTQGLGFMAVWWASVFGFRHTAGLHLHCNTAIPAAPPRTSMVAGVTNWPLRKTISTCNRPRCHSNQSLSPSAALAAASASAALAGGAITADGSHSGTSEGTTPLMTAAVPPTASTAADAARPAVLSCLARLSWAGNSLAVSRPGAVCGEPVSRPAKRTMR